MQPYSLSFIERKLLSVLCATIAAPLIIDATLFINNKIENRHIVHSSFENDMIVYFYTILFSGVVIITYGLCLSILIEVVRKKWFSKLIWFDLLLHGFFGALPGIVTKGGMFAVWGMLIAFAFACASEFLPFESIIHKIQRKMHRTKFEA